MPGGPGSRAIVRQGAALAAVLGGLFFGFAGVGPADAGERVVRPGADHLARAVAAAAPGDTLRLLAGDHAGGLIVDKPLTLLGEAGARLVGPGRGRVVTLDAPDSAVRGLTITGSGLTLASEDSGVFLTARAIGAQVEGNVIDDNLIGVNVKGARDALIRGNTIRGRSDLRVNERGNGVQVWNAPGTVVEGNDISFGRDGIFVTTSQQNSFRRNTFRELRFAVHYMYTNRSEVTDNRSFSNDIGYAIMYSTDLTVTGNLSQDDRDHGILLNYTNESRIAGNVVRGGPEKCIFIYNANKNAFEGNRFEGCGIGIHFTAGSERNAIDGNAFVANRTQVKYVGTRFVEWSRDGRGNYWSDNTAFDLNGDGIADAPYRPNDLVDQIVWRHPLAMLLLNSPATQVLRWAQSAFPAIYPGGVTDSYPLMAAPGEG
jgi:nitrous oxidase accessory protein